MNYLRKEKGKNNEILEQVEEEEEFSHPDIWDGKGDADKFVLWRQDVRKVLF